MRFTRNHSLWLTILAFVTMCSPSFAQSGGSLLSDFYTQMPTIYTRGVVYSSSQLTFAGSAPTTATTTVVAWTWAFNGQAVPAGTIVQLCNVASGQQLCLDVSSTPHGTTTLFQGDSLSGGAQYVVRMKVPGSGSTGGIYPSNTDQVIVNYLDN